MIRFFNACFLLATLTGCASYQSRVELARQDLINGQCSQAVAKLSELSAKADGDQLVYLMEQGTALQTCRQFKASNAVFLKADKLSEQLDYHSASRVVGATLLNEEMLQYKGDTFEKLFINASLALNYLQLGETDDALVEVRRINEKFKKYNFDEKKKFELNSFSQYLSGLIWEFDKKYDDACISYKSAYQLDPTLKQVGLDMLRGCWLAHREQEVESLIKKVEPTKEELELLKKPRQKNKNEVVIIFMQGLGPRKAPRPENRIFPRLVSIPSITQSLQVTVDSETSPLKEVSRLVYNVEKAAIDTLEDDYKSLVARRIGAYAAKEVVADQIRQKDKTLGTLAWLVMVASEKADLRQWSLLPKTVQVIRLSLDKSVKKLKLSGLDYSHQVSENFEDIQIDSALAKNIFLIRSLK